MLRLYPQGFRSVHMWSRHISCTVSDQELIHTFRAVAIVESDAFVVNLNHFAACKVIVHDHLVSSSNQCTSYLNWSEPIHMKMSDDATVKKTVHVSDIFWLTGYVSHTY